MNERALRRLVLEMACGPDPVANARLAALPADAWTRIAAMITQHRLEPLLHARYGSSAAIPEECRSTWRNSHRFWACNAMAHRQDLIASCALLEAHGFTPVALKGAFLAWYAYPEPALRPLRDLDILIGADRAAEAFDTLCAAGYVAEHADEYGHAAGTHPAATKHLGPVKTPGGTVIELHRQLWENDGTLDHRLPSFAEDAIRARSVRVDGIVFPAPEDILVHLIVHAVYSHRLDCGPLLLWDIRHLTSRYPIDWDRLWCRAHEERWERGGALVASLVRRFFSDGAIPLSASEPPPPPAELIESALDLLLQDLSTRRSAGVAASGLARGRRGLSGRLAQGRNHAHGGIGATAGAARNFAVWALPRLRRTASELGRPAVRQQAKELAQLSVWLGV